MSVHEHFDRGLPHAEISVERTFDAGHRIVGHEGKCARLHGHTYRVHLMASGPVKDPGFVVDFGHIKDLIDEWDHMMLLWEEDPFAICKSVPLTGFQEDEGRKRLGGVTPSESGIVRLPFNPTAENMSRNLAEKAFNRFNLDAIMVELWETPKNMARYVI